MHLPKHKWQFFQGKMENFDVGSPGVEFMSFGEVDADDLGMHLMKQKMKI